MNEKEIAAAMLAAHQRRIAEMPTAIIIPMRARPMPIRNRSHSRRHRAINR